MLIGKATRLLADPLKTRDARRLRKTPVLRINSLADISVKSGIGPIPDPRHERMFHGVPVNVIHVTPEVLIVANRVVPESSLPDVAFLAMAARRGRAARRQIVVGQGQGHPRLDQFPAYREIGLAFRERPHGVQMIGQEHHGHDVKRPLAAGEGQGIMERPPRQRQSQDRPTMIRDNGKEERSAFDHRSAIVAHTRIICPRPRACKHAPYSLRACKHAPYLLARM